MLSDNLAELFKSSFSLGDTVGWRVTIDGIEKEYAGYVAGVNDNTCNCVTSNGAPFPDVPKTDVWNR